MEEFETVVEALISKCMYDKARVLLNIMLESDA